MREILFRGKRLDTGEWVESRSHLSMDLRDTNRTRYYLSAGCRPIVYVDYNDNMFSVENKNDMPFMVTIDPKTFGQYAGFNDKTDKKIFEGDIIRFCGGYAEGNWVGTVQYDERNAAFVAVGIMPCRRASSDTGEFKVPLLDINKDTIEVIGNQGDSADILKGE